MTEGTTSRTVSMSIEDWDLIVKSLLDHAEAQNALGWTGTAAKVLVVTGKLIASLGYEDPDEPTVVDVQAEGNGEVSVDYSDGHVEVRQEGTDAPA